MKLLKILFCCCLSIGFLTAQSTLKEPVVYSIVGKAKFIPAEGKKQKIRPGTTLSTTGSIQVKKRTIVSILYRDAYLDIIEEGTFDMAELINSSVFRGSDAIDLFSRRIADSRYGAFQPPRFGFAGGEDDDLPPKKEKVGGGNKDRKVIIISPLDGKLSGNSYRFEWKAKYPNGGHQQFEFVLKNRSGIELNRQPVLGTNLVLDLNQVGCEVGNKYTWEVMAIGLEDINSGPVEFEYVSATEQAEELEDLEADPAYQTASPATRLLMEAAYLEYFNYLAAARMTLVRAGAVFPKDPLVYSMLKSFDYRFGISEEDK